MTKPVDSTLTPELTAAAAHRRATWSMTSHNSLDAMKADEYRYWQSQPGHARLAAASQLALEAYGPEAAQPNVPRLQRPFVQLERE